ncbi:ribosome biogenesis GTPase Der [Candidatus Saccharibacteria bacterium RIFCSPHIGHO2_12_FULL_49_19]|nr:MAG: ribosome biogenesis GTPase Der [Candidatus Saccharibacteria bacterium RIFCSPHIGHO2_12_FULL_49_19]OGL37333.1 MAG: ribosome biogenesis GTPase Der [Candidatus Saccharibacteria bacterium RIFCSPLOWO2_01_FULL_49_22]
MNQSAPIVAIVGRANVGKSSLYNAVLGRREAVVAREAGTTRDSVTAKVSYGGKDFWLVDTAGVKPAADEFEMTIQDQISQAAEAASLIWVVVEAGGGTNHDDRSVARLALKTKKPVILVVNKSEAKKRKAANEWSKLGLRIIFATSATQKKGLDELVAETAAQLPKAIIKDPTDVTSAAILGRPNVGKSLLFNALGKKQQAIVSPRAGTTRDINRLSVKYHDRTLEFLDTAGIRRSGRVTQGAEQFSVLRSLAAIEQSQVCLLVMDAQEPSVQLDQKIAQMIKDAGKGLIIVVNKWDLSESHDLDKVSLSAQVVADFAFAPWAPLVFVSALNGLNVTKLFELILDISKTRSAKISTPELNKWLSDAVNIHPPAGLRNRQPKLNYMTQEDDQTMPSFKIFGKDTKLLHFSYRRYLERSFRQKWPFAGTPIKFWFIDNETRG